MTPRVLLLVVMAAVSLQAQVTFDRILRARHEPQNWLTYSGTLLSQRHSQLTQVTLNNVKDLRLEWVYQGRSFERFEATPLVVDGVLYTVVPPNSVVALDAISGRTFWVYQYVSSPQARLCCGRVNRGLAILGDTLFMATIDAHLVAIDARSGRPLWNVAVSRPDAGYSFTLAPLVVKDRIIVGPAGGEYGIRGFVAAFDTRTGAEVWRFKTIPEPGEAGHDTWAGDSWQRGGAPAWLTGSYDPDLNLTYWGIGNPGPDWNGDGRAGDNLYSDSVVALDADTGKLKWHFQFTPHDEFDFDAVQIPVLADIQWQGKIRKVMLWANRNGYFYVLDRATGEFLLGKPFVSVNWASGLDAHGKPIRVADRAPSREGTRIFPGIQGGTNWYSPSFSPRTELLYVPAWVDSYTDFTKSLYANTPGRPYLSGTVRSPIPQTAPRPVFTRMEEEGYGAVLAIDPRTGAVKWAFKMTDVTDSGILTTASDLLFTGGREGYFCALNARTGALLWKAALGGQIAAGPITYAHGGRQYVAVTAGNSLFAFSLPAK